MDFFALLTHLANFLAPAMLVASLLALWAPFLERKWPKAHAWRAQTAINFVACSVALGAGLVFFGRDGKMASYGLMLLAAVLAQLWGMRRH